MRLGKQQITTACHLSASTSGQRLALLNSLHNLRVHYVVILLSERIANHHNGSTAITVEEVEDEGELPSTKKQVSNEAPSTCRAYDHRDE